MYDVNILGQSISRTELLGNGAGRIYTRTNQDSDNYITESTFHRELWLGDRQFVGIFWMQLVSDSHD